VPPISSLLSLLLSFYFLFFKKIIMNNTYISYTQHYMHRATCTSGMRRSSRASASARASSRASPPATLAHNSQLVRECCTYIHICMNVCVCVCVCVCQNIYIYIYSKSAGVVSFPPIFFLFYFL
jgi:hypothetical protein